MMGTTESICQCEKDLCPYIRIRQQGLIDSEDVFRASLCSQETVGTFLVHCLIGRGIWCVVVRRAVTFLGGVETWTRQIGCCLDITSSFSPSFTNIPIECLLRVRTGVVVSITEGDYPPRLPTDMAE